jgi:O-methyltransferase involved in polyketide biosynthesis
MHLHEKAGTALFRRITEQFPRGQIAFDGYRGKMVHPQLRS